MPRLDGYRQLSLRAKLALWAMLGVMLMLVSMTILSLSILREDVRHSIADAQHALIDSVATDLDSKIAERRQALALTAAALADGVRLDDDAVSWREQIVRRPALTRLFDAVWVAGPDGRVKYATSSLPQSVAGRKSFRQAMQSGAAVVAEPVAGEQAVELVVDFAIPLPAGAGGASGVLGGTLYLNQPNFLHALGDLRIGQAGYFALLTKGATPTYLMHAKRERIAMPAPVHVNEPLGQALKGFEGSAEGVNSQGIETLRSYRSLRSVPWLLVAAYPTSEAYASLHARERQLLAVAAAMALISGLCIWWLAGRVLAPLQRLERAMNAWRTTGDMQGLDVQGQSREVASVVQAFNDLMQHKLSVDAALAHSERRLRAITDHVPALVAYIDNDATYRFTNAYYQVLFGVDPAGLIGRTVRAGLGEDVHTHVGERITAVLRGEPQCFECRVTARGREVFLQANYIPDRDAAGMINGFYVLTLDITERKRSEQLLADGERRMRLLTDNLPALVTHVDAQQRYTFVNALGERVFGMPPQAVLGRSVREVRGEALYQQIEPYVNQALQGQIVTFEGSSQLNGQTVHYRSDYIPDVDAAGQVRGYYAMTFDVTEPKTAQLKLAHNERMLRAITDHLPALVTHVDAQQRYTFVNAHVTRMFGLRPQAMLGRTMREVCGDDVYAAFRVHVERVLGGEEVTFESAGDPGGPHFEGRHYHSDYIPDVDAAGNVRGFFSLTFDLTERKRAEMLLAQKERMLRAITDNLPVLISYVDRDEKVRFFNRTLQDWTGIDHLGAVGRPLSEVIGPERYAQRQLQLRRAIAGERVEFDMEAESLGVHRHLQTVYIPDCRDDGHVAGVFTLTTDVSVMKEAQRQLDTLARVDSLTGLPNRRQFDERLREALARARRDERSVALMFLDLDQFKGINDTLGHAGGDTVLREFARRLRATVRVTDVAARLAGDEFVVLLEGIPSRAEAEHVARKIVEAVRHDFWIGATPLKVTTSLGIGFAVHAEVSAEALMCSADEALYQAKRAGRDGWRLQLCTLPPEADAA